MSAFARPRLAEHVLPRRHVVDGVEQIVLHDTRDGGIVRVTPREWELLACADGTRDEDGIALAAARDGAYRRMSELRALLQGLHDAGLLTDGVDGLRAPEPPATPEARPLDVLRGYALRCDGRGLCCAQYGSIELAPEEAQRARVLVSGAHAGFVPLRGTGGDRDASVAAPLIDGRCAYLDDDARCALHVAGGAEAKPLACRMYPATFIDDGESVRVSVAVECACVLASVGLEQGRGEPLVPAAARVRGDLAGGVKVRVLGEKIAITAGRAASRAEIAAWSREVAREVLAIDAVTALWSLARAVESDGASPAAARRALVAGGAPASDELMAPIRALAARAASAAASADEWRSERDPARRSRRVLAEASARVVIAESRVDPVEAFYVRAALHGHHLIGVMPLADALRDRAVRVVVAREMTETPYALAVIDATLRGMSG